MADIRINSLPTTASASSSDDFLALDGATNGTRKLNAYSPTFGGNVTASGNLTLSGATSTITLGSTNTGSIAVDANGALIVTPKAGQATTLSVSGNSGLSVNNGATQIYLGNSGGNAVAGTLNANDFLLIRDGAVKLTATATGVDIGGNLTVSGTGNNIFNSGGGNLLIGTTNDAPNARLHVLGANNAGFRIDQGSYNYYSAYEHIFQAVSFGTIYGKFANNGSLILKSDGVDSSNGRLQLATHTTSAGGIGFGTDVSLYRSGNNRLFSNAALIVNSNNSGSAINGTFQLNGGGTSGGNNILDDILWGAQGLSWLRIYGIRDAGGGYGGTQYFQTMNGSGTLTTALTLDSSQNATFAGSVTMAAWPQIGNDGNATYVLQSKTDITAYTAGSATGTLTNAPSAGNPTKWITINDNGTLRRIPTW